MKVPADWNLSAYEMKPDFSRLAMEDDLGVRLELEWMRAATMPEPETLRRRYDRVQRNMRGAGAEVAAVEEMPPGWSAWMFTLPDGRRMGLAYAMLPAHNFCGALTLHFEPDAPRNPLRLLRTLAASFTVPDQPATSWSFYDVAFDLNREFRLTATALQAGSKQLSFEWRARRLFLWFFSPADALLNTQTMEAWCARVLNRFTTVRGPIFSPGPDPGTLVWRRDWRYPFGQFEDLYRRCHRYRARCQHDPSRNQILLSLYQYRHEADLDAPALRWNSLPVR